MKRSRLKPKSAKRKAWDKEWGPKRKAYAQARICPITHAQATDVHEIHGGKDRWQTYREPCMWLAVSRAGHDEIQGWKKSKQLAVKFLTDYDNFDLDRFNQIYKGNEGPIAMQDVIAWMELGS
jgi:hypothetical protein